MGGFNTEGVMPMMPYGGMNGSYGMEWMFFILLIALWGNNGFGGNNNQMYDQFALNDLKNGQRQIDNGIRGVERGICDSTYAMAQQGSQTREQLGFGLRDLSSQLSNCCCETNRNIDSIRYENAKNTCDIMNNATMNTRDIIDNNNLGFQRIVDLINSNTMQDLRDKNQQLTMSALLQQQTANITNITNPRPVPSFDACQYGFWGNKCC